MKITKDQSPKFQDYIVKIHVESPQDQEFLADLVRRGIAEFACIGGFSSRYQANAITLFKTIQKEITCT